MVKNLEGNTILETVWVASGDVVLIENSSPFRKFIQLRVMRFQLLDQLEQGVSQDQECSQTVGEGLQDLFSRLLRNERELYTNVPKG